MKIFFVVLFVQCSAVALIKKHSKACDEQHTMKTEFRLLKEKMDNDAHADFGAIMARMETLIAEYNALDIKCKR